MHTDMWPIKSETKLQLQQQEQSISLQGVRTDHPGNRIANSKWDYHFCPFIHVHRTNQTTFHKFWDHVQNLFEEEHLF